MESLVVATSWSREWGTVLRWAPIDAKFAPAAPLLVEVLGFAQPLVFRPHRRWPDFEFALRVHPAGMTQRDNDLPV
jgi:hypothetical protein